MFKPVFYIALLSIFLNACSSTKNKDTNFLWLNYQQKKLSNKVDTTDSQKKVNSYIISGSVCQIQNNYAESILEFQKALCYDSSAVLFYSIAKSYLALERFDRAIKNSLLALQYDRSFMPVYDILAESYLRKMDLQNAIFSLETANKIEENENRLIALAKIYEYQDIKKSLEYYQKIAKKYKNDIVNLRILELSSISKDSVLYIKTLKKVAKQHSDNVIFSNDLITYYMNHKMYNSLLDYCDFIDKRQSTLNLETFYIKILSNFLSNKEISNNLKFKFLDFIDNRFYYNWKLNFLAGNLALSLSDINLAEQYLDRVLINADTTYNLPLEVAASYLSYKLKDKYELSLIKSTNKYLKNWLYPFYLSTYYFQNNNIDKALYFAKLSLSRDNTRIESIHNLASIYEVLKDFANSDLYFEEALKLEPKNPLINNNYAYSLCARNINLEKALSLSRQAISTETNNSAYLDTYGWINYQLGNYEIALKYIERSISLDKKNTEVLEHLADIYIKLGKLLEAEEVYNQALELEPDNFNLKNKINNLKNKRGKI